jgi:uncharacterized membrane protein
MIPLVVLVASFGLFLLLGRLGLGPWRSWVVCLRWALAAMFLVTASAHFGARRADLVAMVPPRLPQPELLVTLTGLAEIGGALGLLLPRVAPWAATGLALLLLAMFPANVHAARAGLSIGGRPVTPLGPRAALQVLFLGAVLVAGHARAPAAGRDGRRPDRPLGPRRLGTGGPAGPLAGRTGGGA